MSISITIRDYASKSLESMRDGLETGQSARIAGAAAKTLITHHLYRINNQRSGKAFPGARSGFYADAARSATLSVSGHIARISIQKTGFAQRYYGGTIRPTRSKYLTIPARTEAYGRRASEFPNLSIGFGRGGKPRYLQNEDGGVLYWLVKQVTQSADHSVLPSDRDIQTTVEARLQSWLTRITERENGE